MEPRLILREATMTVEGGTAAATVRIGLDGETAVGHAASSDARSHLLLAGEAAVRALRQLLPDGIGLNLVHVGSELSAAERAAWAKLLLSTPEGMQRLLGIARFTADTPGAAAKAVLSAVNRRSALLLGQHTYRVA